THPSSSRREGRDSPNTSKFGSPCREGKHGHAVEALSRFQFSGREFRVIRGVGKVLRLQTQPSTMNVSLSFFAFDRAIKKVASVELDSRLRGGDAQHPPGGRLVNFGGICE